MPHATPTSSEDSATRFWFPAAHRKKVTAAFDGGRLSSDGGVLLLAQAEREMAICTQLAACIADPRDPSRIIHTLPDILRARIFAICCGYEDADDLDTLRHDPGFRLALGKLPGSGAGFASQPTMSRWENAPTTRELARMMAAMVDIYCASYPSQPEVVTLDIDDTCDVGPRRRGDRLPCCCVRARRHRAPRQPVISSATGRQPISPSGVTDTTAGPK